MDIAQFSALTIPYTGFLNAVLYWRFQVRLFGIFQYYDRHLPSICDCYRYMLLIKVSLLPAHKLTTHYLGFLTVTAASINYYNLPNSVEKWCKGLNTKSIQIPKICLSKIICNHMPRKQQMTIHVNEKKLMIVLRAWTNSGSCMVGFPTHSPWTDF